MHPIDGRPLPGLDATDCRRVTRWAQEIGSAATVYPWWNDVRKGVHFCLRPSCEVAVMCRSVFGAGDVLDLPERDGVVRSLYAGRKPAAKKDAEREQVERDLKSEADNAYERDMDHSRAERVKEARRLLRIHESGGTSRPVVTV